MLLAKFPLSTTGERELIWYNNYVHLFTIAWQPKFVKANCHSGMFVGDYEVASEIA